MTEYKELDCGCKLPLNAEGKAYIDYYNINLACPKTWELFCSGKTKGVFQLEQQLGQGWAKKMQPSSIEDLAALGALLRPGCISKDTLITTSSYTHSDGNRRFKRISIEKLYKNRNKYKSILSINENDGSIVDNEIYGIYHTGTRECFKIKIRKYSLGKRSSKFNQTSWHDLECTNDHQILTPKGWVELKSLVVGTRIAVVKRQHQQRRRKDKVSSRHHQSIIIDNTDGAKYFQEICYKTYAEKCVVCGWNESTLDVHHINGNRHTDNSPENLCYLCPNHHRLLNNGIISNKAILEARINYKLPKMKDIEWATYLGKESVGIKDVYDISMKEPHYNFIAGNFVVHNCLQAVSDGKNMTQHYVDRKLGQEEVNYMDPVLAPLMGDTYGIIVYQETAILLAKELAGFSLQEADSLRKAMGKKLSDLMIELKTKFVDGCEKVGKVTREQAEKIFGWIEKSQRYSFNKCVPDYSGFYWHEDGVFTIAEMYEIKNNKEYAEQCGKLHIHEKWNKNNNYGVSLSMQKDNMIRRNVIKDITPVGDCVVYRLRLGNGRRISVTSHHKFPTTAGIRLMKYLKKGDRLFCIDCKKPEYAGTIVKGTYTGQIKARKRMGVFPCFNIEMQAPYHNFLNEDGVVSCNSHAVAYGMISYWTAYVKAHFTVQFFATYLRHARDKTNTKEEVQDLVADAREFGIQIHGPDIRDVLSPQTTKFHIKDNTIKFGILDVKAVGKAVIDKLRPACEILVRTNEEQPWKWVPFLLRVAVNTKTDAMENMIGAGALDFFGLSRKRMLHELKTASSITDKQREWMLLHIDKAESLEDVMKNAIEFYYKYREVKGIKKPFNKSTVVKAESLLKALLSPGYSLQDSPEFLSVKEGELLGIPLTFSKVETRGVVTSDKCVDFINREGKFSIAAEVVESSDYEIPHGNNKGQHMGFLKVRDETAQISCVVFSDKWEELQSEIYPGNTLIFTGFKGNKGSLIIHNATQI